MGLAASQARFLSLTARKSDLEYDGQQVNQQRTILSYKTEQLFDEMVAMKVPTPYAISDRDTDGDGNEDQYTETVNNHQITYYVDGDNNGLADQYETDKANYDAEINRINAELDLYHSRDRILEMDLKNLETQQKEVQTEIDSVKKVIDKNIEMSFKTFA